MDVVGQWTGALARQLRQALRMTAEEFAAHLDVAARTVATWDGAPDVEPSTRNQQLLDTALARATDDSKARFAALRQHPASPVRVPAVAESPCGPAASAGGSTAPLTFPGGPLVVTRECVDWLDRSLREQYQADNLLGPAVLLPALRAHLATIEQLRANARGSLLENLLRVGAGYAEFAGWLSHDAGDIEGASRLYATGLEWAQAAGDDRMAAFVLVRRAVQAIGTGDGAYAARLAHVAQRDATPHTVRVRALAAQTEALGHSLSGNAAEAAQALDQAESFTAAADDTPSEGDPSDGRYCELPLYLRISRAKVHLNLGDGPSAVTAFTDVLDALPGTYRRDRSQYLARLAHASALAGLPEQACAHARESLTIASETGSHRTLGDLRQVLGSLASRWSTLGSVRELHENLAAASAH